MQKYQNNVTNRNGDAAPGLSVIITTGGVVATIYSDNGLTPAPNPLTTDVNGYFEFYAPDGRYNISVADAGGYSDVLIADTLLVVGQASSYATAALGSANTATTQAGLAATAKTGAEAARDEAVPAAAVAATQAGISTTKAAEAAVNAGIASAQATISSAAAAAAVAGNHTYTTTAQGLTATTNGQLFLLKTADPLVYDVYTNTAGVAVYGGKYAAASAFDAANLKYQFVFDPQRNLYNKDLAVADGGPRDGYSMQYSTGVAVVSATSMILGRTPVSQGVTYVAWMGSAYGFDTNKAIYCWDAAGTFLGIDHTVGGTAGMANPPTGVTWVGTTQVTFTIPSGSSIAFVGFIAKSATHTTADFNAVIASMQVEAGARTPYQSYAPAAKGLLKDVSLPAKSQRVNRAFTTEAQRNLYDKSRLPADGGPADGQVYQYSTGAAVTAATFLIIGKVAVEAGKTYVAWMGDPRGFDGNKPIYCWNAAGVFLGVDHTIGGTAGMANPPTGVTWVGSVQVTFTIPPGSAIAFVGFTGADGTHTTPQYQATIDSVQVEENVRTAYQPYSLGGIEKINADALPAAAPVQPTGSLSVTRSGNSLYLRGSFDDTYDLVQLVLLGSGNNNTVNPQGTRKCLKSETSNVTAWSVGTVIDIQADSACPMYYNGTYIGGNHGAQIVREVTATAHGKTVVDVGSDWVDALPRRWTLMKIVDANKLWFVSENIAAPGAVPAWAFAQAFSGTTLTHSFGATNTGPITIGSHVSTQLWPAVQGETVDIRLDSKVAITADGTYYGTTVDVVDRYNITNPSAVLDYVRAHVGSATQPTFIDASISADVKRSITYRYAENLSCTLYGSPLFLNAVSLAGAPAGYIGETQAQAQDYSGKALWQYIPRVSAVSGYDFQAQADISGTIPELHLGSAYWTDPNNPPDRMAQIVKSTGGVAERGMMVGYSPARSVGVPSLRKTLIDEACFISVARKQYPKAVTPSAAYPGGLLQAGTSFDIVAFRTYWSAANNPLATVCAWYRDGNSVIVVADFHQNVTRQPLKLPSQFVGMDVTVVDKTASFTLHGNGVVSADGLLVSVSSGYGYAVLKLS